MKIFFTLFCIFSSTLGFTQFKGNDGDGHDHSTAVGIRIDGVVLTNTILFYGGKGDGATFLTTSTSLLPEGAVIFAGGRGDGHSSFLTILSLNNEDVNQLFVGGDGDGSSSNDTYTLLNSTSTEILFAGGNGDGVAQFRGDLLTLAGDIAVLFNGGDGDGHAQQAINDLIMGGMSAELFAGGSGDGIAFVLLNPQTLIDNNINMYEGGHGDGAMGQVLEGFLFEALPVEWISFEAMKQGTSVLLKWSTASEVNNDRFEIERSADALLFHRIDDIPGSGNSTTINDYQSIDASPLTGHNYYRIKQVDYDGNTSFTAITLIQFENTLLDLQIYPNPNKDRILNISVEGKSQQQKARVNIFSMQGVLLKSLEVQTRDRINLPWDWAPGIYQIQLDVGGKKISKRLMVID